MYQHVVKEPLAIWQGSKLNIQFLPSGLSRDSHSLKVARLSLLRRPKSPHPSIV